MIRKFDKIEKIPPIGNLLRNVPYSFNDDLTAMEFCQTVYKYLESINQLTDEMREYLNHFIETFDEKLYETSHAVISDMIDSGLFNTLIEQLVGFFGCHVSWFGAKGDGKTDDTDSIQKALDYGGSVYFSSGKIYRVSKSLEVMKNTYIYGQGCIIQRATLLDRGGYIFINGRWMDKTATLYNGEGNIRFYDVVIDSNVDEFPTVSSPVALNHGYDMLFQNCTFKNIGNGHGIDINGCRDVKLKNCNFLGYRDLTEAQTRVYAEAIQISASLEDSFPYLGGWDGTPTINVEIDGCYVGDSDGLTTRPFGVAVGNHSASQQKNKNIRVTNCHFVGGLYCAFRLYAMDNVYISDIQVDDYKGLVFFHAINSTDDDPCKLNLGATCENVTIRNVVFNQKAKSNYPAIRAWGSFNSDGTTFYKLHRDITIENLTVKSDRNITAFDFDGCEDVYLNGLSAINTFRGFLIKNVKNIKIKNSLIESTDERAIYIQANVKDFIIDSNIIKSFCETATNAVSGINVTGGSEDGLITNNIFKKSLLTKSEFDFYVSTASKNINALNNINARSYVPYAVGRNGVNLTNNSGGSFVIRVGGVGNDTIKIDEMGV